MSHMVIYRNADGKPGFQPSDDLVSAVGFVERIRNTEGVENARIYRLEQINFSFQPYYQVHLDDGVAPSPPALVVADTRSGEPTVSSGPPTVTEATVPSTPAPANPAPLADAPSDLVDLAASNGYGPAPFSGATPTSEHADNGIRRGLFGR